MRPCCICGVAQQSLVRRVLRVAEESRERVVLEVSRFGYSRHAQLEFVAGEAPRESRRVEREQFSSRLRRILTDHFPDETMESLATSADLHHSISGSYTRGVVRRGSEAYAVLGASPNEDAATIDGILTFGLIWLQHARDRARRYSVHGLRLFLPRGTSSVTAHRMAALASPQEVELYEYEPVYWRVRRHRPIRRGQFGHLDRGAPRNRASHRRRDAAGRAYPPPCARRHPDRSCSGLAGSDAAISRPGVRALAHGRDVVWTGRPPEAS